MTPDKIYIKEFDEGISQLWSREKSTKTTAIVQYEYIRKDALLEWAKGLKSEMIRWQGLSFRGAEIVIDVLINKLESL